MINYNSKILKITRPSTSMERNSHIIGIYGLQHSQAFSNERNGPIYLLF